MKKRKKTCCFVMMVLVVIAVIFSFLPQEAKADSNDVPGIVNGAVYYIKNVYNGKYLDVKNGTDANGTDVWTYTFNATAAQRWRAERNSDGSYTFYSKKSNSGRVLDITNGNVDIWTHMSTAAYQKFTLVRETSLQYGGTYQIKNGSRYMVWDLANDTVNMQSFGNGLNALWSFEPVTKGHADIYTFYYPKGDGSYYDSRGAASAFISACSNMGYQPYHLVNNIALGSYNYLKSDTIWVFRGHGLETANDVPLATICYFNGSGGNNGHITADHSCYNAEQVYSLSFLSQNALAKEQCILFIGCSTGVSCNGYNLVSMAFTKGAHFALGTTRTVYTPDSDLWTTKFFEKAKTGATIRACIDNANYYQSLGLLYYEGDVYTKLK